MHPPAPPAAGPGPVDSLSGSGSRAADSQRAPALQSYACTTCVQRKVKCDKQQPCVSCVRSRLKCRYRNTPPPPRRKHRLADPNPALLARLRAHEATLRHAGLLSDQDQAQDPDRAKAQADGNGGGGGGDDDSDGLGDGEANGDDDQVRDAAPPSRPSHGRTHSCRSQGYSHRSGSPQSAAVPPDHHPPHAQPRRGILVAEHGGKRYYEYGLIGALGAEFRQHPLTASSPHGGSINAVTYGPQGNIADSLGSNVVTGSSPASTAASRHQHPLPAHVFRYWSLFLANVHPLTKIIHVPHVQQIISMSGSDSLSISDKNTTDALRYSIYACAVASLDADECHRHFGASQASLLDEWQSAARDALFGSSFLRVPDLDLLRALVLLLTSMLQTTETASLWIQMGSALRMAESQGLHRDGAALELSPFETEMRRRLWWYMVTLDGRLTELMGAKSSLPPYMDVLLPSNVNDNDLNPTMNAPPQGRVGATEMTFCLARYEIALFLREHDPRSPKSSTSMDLAKSGSCRSVSDLERVLEERYLRFCDPVVPVQFLTTTSARSGVCKLRQMAQHRTSRHYAEDAANMSSEQRNLTLNTAARNVKYDNLIHTSKSLRGFLWHTDFHFPWGAPILILKILASSAEWDDDMQVAWERIEELYDSHPEYATVDKVPHLILSNLTQMAWATRHAWLNAYANSMPNGNDWQVAQQQTTPAFVAALQAAQMSRQAQGLVPPNGGTVMRAFTGQFQPQDYRSADGTDAGAPVDYGGGQQRNGNVERGHFGPNLDYFDPAFAAEMDLLNWSGY